MKKQRSEDSDHTGRTATLLVLSRSGLLLLSLIIIIIIIVVVFVVFVDVAAIFCFHNLTSINSIISCIFSVLDLCYLFELC